MTLLYIAEYAGLAASGGDSPPATVPAPPLVVQTPISTAGAATFSAAFNAQTKFVEVSADTVCSIKFSPSTAQVAATVNDIRLAAGERKLFGVPYNPQGAQYVVSAILNT